MTVEGSIETGTRPVSANLHPLDAWESALSGRQVRVVDSSGARRPLPAAQWLAAADHNDRRLMLDHCVGPTLDLGCGPGRMLVALAERSVTALGVDASRVAVALARSRGGQAIQGDVLQVLSGNARWRHALLADGNIGIGGDPVRLLRRVAARMDARGSVLVEIDPPGIGLRYERLRLDVAGRLSTPFRWALLGVDAIEPVAKAAGLRLRAVRHNEQRHVTELTLPTQRSRT